MTGYDIRCVPVSETSVMLYLADVIDAGLAPAVGETARAILDELPEVREVTPSYTSILVEVGSLGSDFEALAGALSAIACRVLETGESELLGKLIELPVYYDPEVGEDLESLAEFAGLSVDEVIGIHTGREYSVCAIGFAPGFAFLGEVDERIAMPRQVTPRSHVPAGSVGIAGRQTAVYPADTPGGWQLIGNCPVSLYDPENDPPSPLEVGDRVRFCPIEREVFLERGGHV